MHFNLLLRMILIFFINLNLSRLDFASHVDIKLQFTNNVRTTLLVEYFYWIGTWFRFEARGRKREEVRGCDKCEAAWTEQAGNKSSKFNGSTKFGVIGLLKIDFIEIRLVKQRHRRTSSLNFRGRGKNINHFVGFNALLLTCQSKKLQRGPIYNLLSNSSTLSPSMNIIWKTCSFYKIY